MKAILLVSHGSQSSKTKREVEHLVEALRRKTGEGIFRFAFLEIEHPDIHEGIAQCVKRGASEILVLLNFLNSGKHVDEDIPAMIAKAKEMYPDVNFEITKPIGLNPAIIDLFDSIIKEY